MKKNQKNQLGSVIVAITAIAAIFLIVLLVSISIGKNYGATRSNIIVSIDKEGNVYNGDNQYVGTLSDPNFKFYDEEGNLLGQTVFNIIK